MKIRHLEVADSIWKDKRIPKETKLINSYIYTKGFEKDVKRLENEKVKLNDRLSNLVDMKLDNIIDNDTYIKKRKSY